jgi:GT2 family glycosyltransferase
MRIIHFIVVNFNNYQYTKLLIKSLLSQQGIKAKFNLNCIIINNSTDNEDTKLLNEYCNDYSHVVRVINSPKNCGYFGGLNIGLASIADIEKSFVVIGNNDLEFAEDFCDRLISTEYSYKINVICPGVITPEGYNQNPHIPVPISSFRRFQFDVYFSHYYAAFVLNLIKNLVGYKKSTSINYDKGEIHMGIGACYILTRSFFEHSCQLECPTFLYGEEAFLSHQIHSNGGILYFDPALKVFHAESATLSKIPKRQSYEYARDGYSLYRKFM